MSSILNALKRLEAERQTTPGNTPPAWLAQAEVQTNRLARFQALVLSGGRKGLVAVMLLLVAAAALWISGRPMNPGAKPEPVAASRAREPLTNVSHRQTVNRPAQKAPLAGPAAVFRTPTATLAPPPVMPWAESLAKPTATRVPAPVVPPPSNPSVLPVPLDAGLTLQAISWSEQSHKRIAVVNNRVLHQGDTVAGYRVEKIDPDTVTLSRAGRIYHLAFGAGA